MLVDCEPRTAINFNLRLFASIWCNWVRRIFVRNIWFGLRVSHTTTQPQSVTKGSHKCHRCQTARSEARVFLGGHNSSLSNLRLAQLILRNPCRRSGSNECQTTSRLLGPSKEPHTQTHTHTHHLHAAIACQTPKYGLAFALSQSSLCRRDFSALQFARSNFWSAVFECSTGN